MFLPPRICRKCTKLLSRGSLIKFGSSKKDTRTSRTAYRTERPAGTASAPSPIRRAGPSPTTTTPPIASRRRPIPTAPSRATPTTGSTSPPTPTASSPQALGHRQHRADGRAVLELHLHHHARELHHRHQREQRRLGGLSC